MLKILNVQPVKPVAQDFYCYHKRPVNFLFFPTYTYEKSFVDYLEKKVSEFYSKKLSPDF